jgi:ABC-type amino acid transport substrate-binding protein
VSTTLRVGAALPDPPFNDARHGGGLDVSLMEVIAEALGMTMELVPYSGADFDGIFDRLGDGAYECITSGTTVTPHRERKAAFCKPYLISGQALAVDANRLANVRGVDDLAALTIGVQDGTTSQLVAEKLATQSRAKAVRVYPYGDIRTAITDLTTGGCDAFMKLAPVLVEVLRPVPGVKVVQRGLSTERIATAVRTSDHDLFARIDDVQRELERSGRLGDLRSRWLGDRELDQSGSPLVD